MLPVSPALVELARSAGAVAVVEDNLVSGGIGSAVTFALREAASTCRCTRSASRSASSRTRRAAQLLEELGLTADTVVAGLAPKLAPAR